MLPQTVSSIDGCASGEKFCLCEAVRVLFAVVSNVLTECERYRRQRTVASLPSHLVGLHWDLAEMPWVIARQADWPWVSFRGASRALAGVVYV